MTLNNKGKSRTYFRGRNTTCRICKKKVAVLEDHLWSAHNLGNRELFKCNEKDCDYATKSNYRLKNHKWIIHNLGGGMVWM
jgi:hypothetical protein